MNVVELCRGLIVWGKVTPIKGLEKKNLEILWVLSSEFLIFLLMFIVCAVKLPRLM